MELEQLPKAQKFFKQIVDKKVQQYIQSSSKLADYYVKQKEQALTNSIDSFNSLDELKRQIQVLKTIQATKIKVPGTTLSEIQQLINKYQQVIVSYDEKIMGKVDLGSKKLNSNSGDYFNDQIINSEQSQNLEENSFVFQIQQNRNQNSKNSSLLTKKRISLVLKLTQFIVFSVMILTFTKTIFFV